LVIPGDFDDRVVPSHAYRYAARLQELNRGNRPVYLHTRLGASHGSTGTAQERIRYEANRWTFLMQQLGMD
jgi:prolyl oligopeptidase